MKTDINRQTFLTDQKFEQLRRLSDLQERLLSEHRTQWAEVVEKEATQIPDSDLRAEFHEYCSGEHRELSEDYPVLIRNSYLATLHTFLAQHLLRVCEKMKKEQNLPVSVDDLRYGKLAACR